jgi:hypothetical protein
LAWYAFRTSGVPHPRPQPPRPHIHLGTEARLRWHKNAIAIASCVQRSLQGQVKATGGRDILEKRGVSNDSTLIVQSRKQGMRSLVQDRDRPIILSNAQTNGSAKRFDAPRVVQHAYPK